MKIIKVILAVLFGIFAIVQYNDPDPWLWIAIYGIVSVLFILNITGWYNRTVIIVLLLIAFAYSFVYLPGVIEYFKLGEPGVLVESMQAKKPYIEETREYGGMWLIIFALLFLLFKGKP